MNRNNNFTALRWLAAGLVLYGHSFVFLGLPEPAFMGWVALGPLGVYIFFSISGYLVAQSWVSDPNYFRFLRRRALRIFPGLIVCTVLTVVLLGPLMTDLRLVDYFKSQYTRGYFTNIGLYMTYYLPGVFETNTYPSAVNGSLWTLPAEFSMYLALALFGLLRVPRIGWVVATLGLMALSKFWAMQTPDMLVYYRTDVRQIVICGVYFWVGAAFLRYKINRFFSTTSIFGAVIIWLCLTRWPEIFVMASWVILPYLALAFGLASSPWLSRLTRYDYSYGIYIYAFPIQQTVAKFWPQMPIGLYLAITGTATLVLAALSWHWIEHPALKLKPTRPRNVELTEESALTISMESKQNA
jgi:peptidoglycan/LPS O-acetylase OafA/YrhL